MKIRAKLLWVLVLLLGLTMSMTSIAAPPQAKYTFYAMGVSPGVDPFWATVYEGIKAADDLFPVKVVYVGMKAEELNAAATANKLEIARAAKPDGIITGFWFLVASDEVCRNSISEGIPIIAYNMEDPRPKNERIPYLGYIGMDERVTGDVLARATLDKIDIKRAAIGIQYPGSASLETRASGIIKVLKEKGIPYDKLDITPTPSTAINVLGAYITKYPETNMLFLLGPVGTHPALQLIKEKGLKGKVFISTFDVSEKTLNGIRDGAILLTISQQAFAQGFLAVQSFYLYHEYGIIPPQRVETGPTLIDDTNVKIIEKQLKMTSGG